MPHKKPIAKHPRPKRISPYIFQLLMSSHNNMVSFTVSNDLAPFLVDPRPIHRLVQHPASRVLLLAFLADPRRYVVVCAGHSIGSQQSYSGWPLHVLQGGYSGPLYFHLQLLQVFFIYASRKWYLSLVVMRADPQIGQRQSLTNDSEISPQHLQRYFFRSGKLITVSFDV